MNIPNAKIASLQEIFDFAYKSLITQGQPAGHPLEQTFVCKYRGPNNTKCAVGMFIPDSLYNPELDMGGNFSKVMYLIGVDQILDDLPNQRWSLFSSLQMAHDQAARDATTEGVIDNEKWLTLYKENMASLALRTNLTVPETVDA